MLSDAKVQPMLPVKDLGKAQKFYEQTLGLKRVGEVARKPSRSKAAPPRSCLSLRVRRANKGNGRAVGSRDVDETVKELSKASVRAPTSAGTDPKGAVTGRPHEGRWFKDPGGNILSVQNRDH